MASKIVKWPGTNIHEDTTHRLVTDEQIDRWDRISNIDSDVEWIELTPENISEYTATKEDPDGYWTDMGMAEGTIFDSSTLEPGNYIIKLGMDKLVKMNSVSLPGYTYATNHKTIANDDFNSPTFFYKTYYNTGVPYFNYGIDPTTMIFLCQFFGVEFSLDDLINKLNSDYYMNIRLTTETNVTVYTDQDSGDEQDNEKIELKYSTQNALIRWPDCIRIQIIQNSYCYPEDNKTIINRYIYSDLRIIDYSTCANYEIDTSYIHAYCAENNMTIAEYFESGTRAVYTPLLDSDGNQRFQGVPAVSLLKQNCCKPEFYYIDSQYDLSNAGSSVSPESLNINKSLLPSSGYYRFGYEVDDYMYTRKIDDSIFLYSPVDSDDTAAYCTEILPNRLSMYLVPDSGDNDGFGLNTYNIIEPSGSHSCLYEQYIKNINSVKLSLDEFKEIDETAYAIHQTVSTNFYLNNKINTYTNILFGVEAYPHILSSIASDFDDNGVPQDIRYEYDYNKEYLYSYMRIRYDIQNRVIDNNIDYFEDTTRSVKSYMENGGTKLYLEGAYAYNALESDKVLQITLNGETKVYNNTEDVTIDLDTSMKSMDLTNNVEITSAITLDSVTTPGTYTMTEGSEYMTANIDYPFFVSVSSLTVTKTSEGRVIQRVFDAYTFCEYIRINPNAYGTTNGWRNVWKDWAKIEYNVPDSCLAEEE